MSEKDETKEEEGKEEKKEEKKKKISLTPTPKSHLRQIVGLETKDKETDTEKKDE